MTLFGTGKSGNSGGSLAGASQDHHAKGHSPVSVLLYIGHHVANSCMYAFKQRTQRLAFLAVCPFPPSLLHRLAYEVDELCMRLPLSESGLDSVALF